ncbi:CsbD family protein [Methylobacterium crusticola]|uniref:CsbD family protein n=1 Tax=Methylobacterium crusticola TaxID=1697972 RepID=UPI000FFBE8E8|nr:CsbD family protein [Methylobacterium crusticola]
MSERRATDEAEARKGSVAEAIGKITADPELEAKGAAQKAGLPAGEEGRETKNVVDREDI